MHNCAVFRDCVSTSHRVRGEPLRRATWEMVLHMAGDQTRRKRMDAVYQAHFTAIRAYCMRRLPVAEANDAASEVFLAAWRRIEDLPPGDGALPYLYGIARNKVAHAKRSQGRRSRLVTRASSVASETATEPETIVMARAEADAIDSALQALRPDDREVIRLRAWEELTGPQIAEVLGISTAAAQKRLARALERLGRQLRRHEKRSVPASQKGGER